MEVKALGVRVFRTRAIAALLIGDRELGPSFEVAAPLIQAWSDAEPSHDLPPYLLGRNLFGAGRYADAAKYLDRSLALEPQLPSVRREALRLRLITSCALGDTPRAAEVLALAVADAELPKARAEGLRRMAARCGVKSLAVANGPLGAVAPPAPAASAPTSAPDAPLTCPPKMRLVPGGRFWVGLDPKEDFSSDESPRFLTDLAPFCLDETEVTAGAYGACVERGACQAPPREHLLCNFARPERADHPMNCISWQLADAYCSADGARLPSESEFEYVARGGDRYQKYPWGNESPDGRACWKHPGTCRVKSFAPGAFGLRRRSGNCRGMDCHLVWRYPCATDQRLREGVARGSFSRRFERDAPRAARSGGPAKSGPLGISLRKNAGSGVCPSSGEEAPPFAVKAYSTRLPSDKPWNGVRCASAGERQCATKAFRWYRVTGANRPRRSPPRSKTWKLPCGS